MAYTDKTQIENYLGLSLPATLNAQISNWITAVKQWIDNYTGTTFEGSEQTKYYDGNGSREILVDHFYGTPVVKTLDIDGDTDATISSDYMNLYPLNRDTKDRIFLKAGSKVSIFPSHRYAIEITATFGWSAEPPQQVQLAATRLMGHLLNKRLSGGDVSQESLGDYSVSFSKIDQTADVLGIKNILDQYRNLSL